MKVLLLIAAAALAFGLALALTGCMAPLKPGRSGVVTGGVTATLLQSENPAVPSRQTTRETWTLPPGLPWTPAAPAVPVPWQVSRETETTIGAAQKDTAREVAAKLASFRGIQWLGALVFLFGAASAVWPPLKALIGSVTTSTVIAAAGLALIVLPSLIVGHELLILCGAGAVGGAYWFAHRHGEMRGQLKSRPPP